MSFEPIPAIDLRAGRVVRLAQGDYARETRFEADPLALAREYAAQGARWLHLVDLDAARAGGYTLLPLLRRLAAENSLRIQTGGGVRRAEDVAALLEAGASRVVLGTVAVRSPEQVIEWGSRFGTGRIVLALDARRGEAGDWRLHAAGWTQAAGPGLDSLLATYSAHGFEHVLCTDIERDGMLGGYNLELYEDLSRRWPQFRWQASGGARDARDVRAARAAGAGAAILGRALLEGRFSVAEAMSC